MKALAETADGGFGAILTPLVSAYQAWLDAQQARLGDGGWGMAMPIPDPRSPIPR
jgi:hypothetical protein